MTSHTRVIADGELKGWINKGGCTNPACKKAVKEGRLFHATPAGFAVLLDDYHFSTETAATNALKTLKGRTQAPCPPVNK